jgi:ankyrin repeat protein
MLWEAARHNHGEVVQMLLDNGVNVNVAPYPSVRLYGCALSIAASQGYTGLVRLLLDRGADVNLEIEPHGYPIEGAARCGHEEVVELLLGHGASPERAFVAAANEGQWRLVKRLLEKEEDFHANKGVYEGTVGVEALQQAIIVKNPRVISVLVDAGVSLNDGYSRPDELPIVLAKMVAAEWIVDFLLSLGAEDREYDTTYRGDNYSEDHYDTQMRRGGVRITKRTWEWVGRY